MDRHVNNDRPTSQSVFLLAGMIMFSAGILLFVWIARWDGLNLRLNPATVASLLAPLMLAAGFVERAVEVIISPWRDEEAGRLKGASAEAEKQASLSALQATTSQAVATAAAAQPDVLSQAQQSTQKASLAINDAANVQSILTEYKEQTKKYAYSASLLLGFLVAYVGVRALANLLGAPAHFQTAHQETMFNAVDVAVTAAMLAGGANGIHSVVTAFTSFFDATSKKAQQP